ncbi:hypothetical protein Tco_0779508, partial [Tanacetum coccineum]
VVLEQDEFPSSVGLDFRARLDGGRMYSRHVEALRFLDRLSEIPWAVPTFIVIEGEDIVAKFYGLSRWKELSKESGSKIPNGSCWKAFKPIASLIT